MKNLKIATVFILVLSTVFFACVESTKQLYAPAVIDENHSQLVLIQVETRKTTKPPEVFVSVEPLVGLETQKSLTIANQVSRDFLERNGIEANCDYIVTIPQKNVKYVEGPSAGAAITLMMIAAAENKDLRNDTVITGTIEENGRVGQVGGLTLKAEAAYRNGFKKFLTSEISNSEKIELLMLKNYYNITVIQASDINQVYNFMTSNYSIKENLALKPENRQKFSNAILLHWYGDGIRNVTNKMIMDAEEELKTTKQEYWANFESRLANAKNAFETGNYYTAANIAFLLSIDEETSKFNLTNMVEEYRNTKDCIDSFTSRDKTMDNFEIVGGAEARYLWSIVRLNQSISENEINKIIFNKEFDKDELISPFLYKYKDVINSKYWCLAGKYMEQNLGGEKSIKTAAYTNYFNESKLKEYTEQLIKQVEENIDETNDDAVFHLKSAKLGAEKGMYVAALFDVAYVESYNQLSQLDQNETVTVLNSMLNKNYSFFWSNVFKNHANVIKDSDKMSALRILFIAVNIENYLSDAEIIQVKGTEGLISKKTNQGININVGKTSNTEDKAGINETGQQSTNESINDVIDKINAYRLLSIITIVAAILFVAYILSRVIKSNKKNKNETQYEKRYKPKQRTKKY